MDAPRNDGDIGVVSAVGTPMLKSVRVLMQGERQSFGKAKMTVPGSEGFSSIYSEQQDAMGVNCKGATVPVRVVGCRRFDT
ncbi:hypothetical protein TIFTF001_021085 [Ficus carica]|uniref:Uncharacterized protein n=1 Tax=Ficus carica TaxID=3494 RepID=A0AA88AHA9_FICCA|nr:hypothetical protein TIFTF001_021085 [Ficus carica]